MLKLFRQDETRELTVHSRAGTRRVWAKTLSPNLPFHSADFYNRWRVLASVGECSRVFASFAPFAPFAAATARAHSGGRRPAIDEGAMRARLRRESLMARAAVTARASAMDGRPATDAGLCERGAWRGSAHGACQGLRRGTLFPAGLAAVARAVNSAALTLPSSVPVICSRHLFELLPGRRSLWVPRLPQFTLGRDAICANKPASP